MIANNKFVFIIDSFKVFLIYKNTRYFLLFKFVKLVYLKLVLERIEFVVKKLFKSKIHFIENKFKRIIILLSSKFIQSVRFFSLFLKLVMREHNCSINKIVYNPIY